MDQKLLVLQLPHPVLISRDHAGDRGIKDAIQQLGELPIDLGHLRGQRVRAVLRLGQAAAPQVLKHRARRPEQGFGRLDRLQQRLEFTFDPLAPDRLAVGLAAALGAEVIRIPGMRPGGPAGRERRVAAAADDKPAQAEILIQVLPHRHAASAFDPFLNLHEGLIADQPFMVARSAGDIPIRRFDIPGIGALRQHPGDTLDGDDIALGSGEGRVRLQEALDIGLRFKAPGRVAFERFLDDTGHRLIAAEHPAALARFRVSIPYWRGKHEKPVHHASAHAVDCRLADLLPLVLGDAREKVLHQQRIRILAELDGGRFQNAARADDGLAQLQMSL
ncbi:MAG: hypothetical protein WDN25_13605 [Acetobacteraceae bacterium]